MNNKHWDNAKANARQPSNIDLKKELTDVFAMYARYYNGPVFKGPQVVDHSTLIAKKVQQMKKLEFPDLTMPPGGYGHAYIDTHDASMAERQAKQICQQFPPGSGARPKVVTQQGAGLFLPGSGARPKVGSQDVAGLFPQTQWQAVPQQQAAGLFPQTQHPAFPQQQSAGLFP